MQHVILTLFYRRRPSPQRLAEQPNHTHSYTAYYTCDTKKNFLRVLKVTFSLYTFMRFFSSSGDLQIFFTELTYVQFKRRELMISNVWGVYVYFLRQNSYFQMFSNVLNLFLLKRKTSSA